ncbi:uncharacterized protein OCT59_025510 [Rhizophagus irregularis]|nr:hypothetical protein OCT59_025510 [Rhizophagus irregularis]
MELISTNDKNSFNRTPRLKSSPVPILFIPFDNDTFVCAYCKSFYSQTLFCQRFCENCLFDYAKKLTDNNIYLDVIRNKVQDTQTIQEWCNGYSNILCFKQIITKDIILFDHFNFLENNEMNKNKWNIVKETKCKLCEYKKDYNNLFDLCPNCYFTSSEWIESTLDKKLIPIVYLPWWDNSSICTLACKMNLEYKSDCQKWCSHCYVIYTGCRYCLTTNIIFGITKQSKCRKCKRVININVTCIEYNLDNFDIIKMNNLVNRMNNIKQESDLVNTVYRYMSNIKLSKQYQNPDNRSYPIKENGQIRFISFSNNMDRCNYCGLNYSLTILFEQKYCKYCLYWYHKDLSDKNVCLDVHINNSSNSHCIKHESKNIESYTQNIQEWCMNCSEILYFKQIVTKYSFDMNYYYERQNEIIKYVKDCTLCGRQNLSINTEFSLCSKCYLISFEWIESTLTEKVILILYLSLWYNIEQCIVCKHILNDIPSEASDDCQKWCSNCFTIYIGCRYCLTTNIVFGFTNQSKCKKCKRRSFITIDTKNIMENFIVSTKMNAVNHDRIVKYVNDKNSNLLKLYGFISKLNYIDLKYISHSNLESKENFSIPIIFIPFNNNENICHQCRNEYSLTLLFKQKYCKYCLHWYIKFAKFTTQNTVDVHIFTSNTQCTEHDKLRNLGVCTKNIQEWCIICSEISYFKQIITHHSFDINEQSKVIQSESCKCGKLINHQISFMCLDCYSVSSGYTESTLTKKNIPILYLPWWDTFSDCIVCRQKLKYKSDSQKWCSHCFIIYNGCRYCLTTNIIFGFTNQSQCIKCKKVKPISINGNHNIDEILNSTIDTNDEISKFMNNTYKDNDPLKIYDFIKNRIETSRKNIKVIEYSKTKDFKRIAEGGFGIIYKAVWKINSSPNGKIVAVKKFLKSQNISKYFINELKSFIQYHNRFEHIIKYYGITQDPNTKDHMIIMQYADGGDLHNYLQNNFKNITWKDKLTILLEISRGPRIEEIRKTIALWRCAIKNILHSHINQAVNMEDDEFNQAEKIRLGLIKINKLDPRFAVNSHPGAIYTSRLLNPLISDSESLSISLSSSTFNKKQEYISKDLEFDINNVKRSSLSELNSTTQNSVNNIQCPNAIYTSRPLNEMFPIKQEYSSREIELDINYAQWSPLPDINSTVQNSLCKVAEIKTEIQNNEKLVLQDDLVGTDLQLKSQDQIICSDGSPRTRMGSTTYNKDPVKEFDKLNKEFSDRIKEISGNTEGFKGKGKEGETGNDTLNANKKRSAQSQGAREFSDTDGDKE